MVLDICPSSFLKVRFLPYGALHGEVAIHGRGMWQNIKSQDSVVTIKYLCNKK